MPRSAPFRFPVSVRYLEVDQQGVVFNMWYLAYVDDAMTAFLADGGLGYGTMTDSGVDVQLVHTALDWSGSVSFGDQVTVEVGLLSVGTTSFRLRFDVAAGADPVCHIEVVYVCIDLESGAKTPVPDLLRDALGAVDDA